MTNWSNAELGPYLSLPGRAGNYASTPDSAAVSITGDIDIRVRVALNDWTTAGSLCSKSSVAAGNFSFFFVIQSTGFLEFYISTNGVTAIPASSGAGTGYADGTLHWLRVTRAVSSGLVQFFKSEDGNTWTQIGANKTLLPGVSIFDGTASVQVGAENEGTVNPSSGKFYYAEIRNGIDGPVVAAFDPERAIGGNPPTVVAATGETWTINQSGSPAAVIVSSTVWADAEV